MFLSKMKMAAAVLLAGLAGAAPPPSTDFSSIDQRVQDWQLTKEERRLDEIGWAGDLRQALRLAKEHKRPVFLFAYSGEATEPNAIALRRC